MKVSFELSPSDLRYFRERLNQARKSAGAGDVLYTQRRYVSKPKRMPPGKVYVSRDVTERIRQTEQHAHQERLSVLGEIAAVMAHELNNPLAAISMFSQMLLKGLDTGNGMRAHAEVIHRNTESCKATIRALLDMATTPTAESQPARPADKHRSAKPVLIVLHLSIIQLAFPIWLQPGTFPSFECSQL